MPLILGVLLGALALTITAAPTRAAVILPVEVVGSDGTIVSRTLDIPPVNGSVVRSLWMQIHGLSYPDLASVQINESAWVSLNNNTVTVAEPGRSYGGIGGGFATLKMTMPLPAGLLKEGPNTIRFRFNRTNGVASGFRVLAFNFNTIEGLSVLPADTFAQEDPNSWQPPLGTPADILTGENLWRKGALKANGLAKAPPIRAHCGDCHTADGRDLKYFNFSNASVIARSRFHGLTERQGEQIASYVRSLKVPNPGRPWNPPYQPGPGLDARPIEDWAAGAGLASVLDRDEDSLPFLFPQTKERSLVASITPDLFRPDGNLNVREIPIAMQLPDWNHWLPHVHPIDAWGDNFTHSRFAGWYAAANSGERPDVTATNAWFDDWGKAQHKFLQKYAARDAEKWTPELTEKIYASQLWQLVKTWEITQQYALEGRGQEVYGPGSEARTWLNTIPTSAAPASAGIPDGPNGMGGSALTNEYFSSCWYQLQILVNNGNHQHRDKTPVNWPYFADQFLKLRAQSQTPEPARVLLAIIKSMQSTNPKIGPEDRQEGWRPERNIDPRIMINAEWAPMFQPLASDVKLAITESLLTAWLDKNTEYQTSRYFSLGLSAGSYSPPTELAGVFGGRVWEAAPQFQAAGVRPELVKRTVSWGRAYTDLAQLFHY